ncbi:MAG: foldase protein PrsA [Thermoleophilaceae bacterium]|nr:foldase protein PrsA [Thermoleophilaceae bacterium]MEA2388490.1 foldase protein PrsA [Thermoleophilaceae bacterium]
MLPTLLVMRKIRFVTLFLAALAVALLVAGCGDDVPKNGVAKVGDHVITKAEFNHWLAAAARQQSQGQPGQPPSAAAVPDPPNFTNCIAEKQKQPVPKGAQKPPAAQLKAQCKQQYDGLKTQTMQFLISAQWLQQEADKRGVKATPAQVQKTFEDQKKQAFPKEADYQKFLKTSGRTEADLLFQVKLSVLTNALQAKVTEKAGNPSQKDIADYYNKNKKRFAQPESRDLLVVLTKNQKKAQAALGELKKKKPWKAVVKKYSVDTASKAQGGKLPGVTKGTQEKAFDAAIFSAQKGQIKGPVKTQFGYYVFQVTKVTPASQQTLAQATETIKNLLKSQEQQKALNDFVKDFQKSNRDKTVCAKGFTTEQCKNGPKPKTAPQGGQQAPGGAPSGGPPSAGGSAPAPQQQQVPPSGAPQGAPPGAGGAAPPQQVPPGG